MRIRRRKRSHGGWDLGKIRLSKIVFYLVFLRLKGRLGILSAVKCQRLFFLNPTPHETRMLPHRLDQHINQSIGGTNDQTNRK